MYEVRMKRLIGLTGTTGSNTIAGCGKDTVAAMIALRTGYTIYGFADPLYQMVKAGFGIDGKSEEYQDRLAKANPIPWLSTSDQPISLRYLLETLGTEWGRDLIQPDVWLRLASKFIRECPTGVIIKDVRFPNEAEWLESEGGVLIHILRPDYFAPDATKGHPSNIPLPIRSQNKMIMNDCDINTLSSRVESLCYMEKFCT
jgi:hypothetical protein